ncbi:MAG TPA: GNAT family N-acetyltransferase [Jatrophihabitans sp.]
MFRLATPSDVEPLLPLIREFCEIDGHAFDERLVRHALLPLLADPSLGFVLVDEALSAYAVVTWGYSLESGGREALIDEFYARERGVGLGSAMLEEIVQRIREAGARVLFLETELASARVRGFYARHGFTTEDSVWMQLSVVE